MSAPVTRDELVLMAASIAHEANRIWCQLHGDHSQVRWDDAPEWQRTSAVNGVMGVIRGNTPGQSHEGWLAEKREAGWKYGPVKDVEKKEHPCFVAYDELSPEQRAKDAIFVGVVRGLVHAVAPELMPEIGL